MGIFSERARWRAGGHRVRKESFVNGTLASTDHYVRDASGNTLAIYNNSTLTEMPIYGASRLGVHYKTGNKDVYQLTDHLGNVRAVIAKIGSNAAISSSTDYYPGGMAMPNRNVVGDYRYGYQGEYAEKDEETGLNAFQLRMYDSRINRWISPDPMGEFFSPYLAMGNNWANTTDPTGGCTDCSKCPDACNQLGIDAIPDGQSIDYNFDADSYSLIDGISSFLDEVTVTGFSQGFKNTLSTTTTLFGIAEGATQTLTNSDEIFKAVKDNKFLTKSLNSNNVLRAYQVGAGGLPKFKGNQHTAYDDVLKAANRFKVKAGTLKVLKGTGVLAGVIGTGLSIHDIGTNGLNLENGADAVVGVIGFVPGYGWIVVGVYYVVAKPLAKEGNKAYEWLKNNVRIPTDAGSIMNGFRN